MSIMKKEKPSGLQNVLIWFVQLVLACLFAVAGYTKLSTSIDDLRPIMSWVNDFPPFFVRFVGVSELLGALGLVLPAVLRFKPNLVPLSALCLAIVMVCALVYHLIKGEQDAISPNLFLGGFALFIAWMRWTKK